MKQQRGKRRAASSAKRKRPSSITTARRSARQWVLTEDFSCLEQRAARLSNLMRKVRWADAWTFPGGWLGKQLFEEARYSFVYGQFIATVFLGFAFIERTLAAMFYAAGRDDLQRATSQKLIGEAVLAEWLRPEEASVFDRARTLRNPLVHFRLPGNDELPVSRALRSNLSPYELVEADSQIVIEAMFRLVARNSVR